MRPQMILQRIQHNAWLDTRKFLVGINFQYLVHVLGEIENHGNVAALACEACSSTTRQHRRAELTAGGNGSNYIVSIAGNYQSNWDLPVIGTVSGVKCPAATIEPDFTVDMAFEFRLKLHSASKRINRFGVRTGRKRVHLEVGKNLTADEH